MPFNVLPVLRITCITVWTECKYGCLMRAWMFFGVNEVLRNKLLFGVLHQCVAVLDHLTSQPSCWNNLPPQNERFARSKFIISRLMPRNKGRINTANAANLLAAAATAMAKPEPKTTKTTTRKTSRATSKLARELVNHQFNSNYSLFSDKTLLIGKANWLAQSGVIN